MKALFIFLTGLLLSFEGASQTFRIYTIDVDQADAALIITPGGKSLLIDGGAEGAASRIKQVMADAGITRIDVFVLTHYHADHYCGIDNLAADPSVTIGEAYDRGDKEFLPSSKTDEAAYKNYQREIGSRAIHLMRGETIPLEDGISVRCVASGGVVLNEDPPIAGVDENDMSIGLLIQYGSFVYFTGGDMEKTTEKKIADRDLVMNVDVCKSDHHGSHMCSLPEFMQDMSPSVIIISNGSNGTYKHPRKVTLETYAAMSPKPLVLQTNKYLKGDAEAGNVGDRFIADPETTDKNGTILIEVNRASTSYTISYRDTTITMQVKPRGRTTDNDPVIESLLPDPAPPDSDSEKEYVTLRNRGNQPILLTGYYLIDASGRIWSLDGKIIPAAGSLIVYRNRMPMSLNNDGDEIKLFDSSDREVDMVSYAASEEGVPIVTGH